ncbi:Hsp20/alpha crystallin family protein [Bdellovibrio svalbardensis]|uniref:Hsp20/alpha crystallin family protein n=1 Tax=Bdellovibrio svalbardensis TaxID=2972972 RepID=A0ABT6DG66_9BACT|nr:Hsp20/alpha crystallin family protein [Bdellovibrio svalbardensis]MDG0815811.1 Hsp20/alpha crystallin family protein [Bdellovibrio svalbardensis]
MNLSFRKLMIPAASAVVGGVAVLAVLKMNPALRLKLEGDSHKAPKIESPTEDIFDHKNRFRNNFDGFFDDDIFDQEDPFRQMKRMREQMEKRMRKFAGEDQTRSNSFESWFSDKLGGGGTYGISKREDDGFIYYDIRINDLNPTSIDTKVENGYVTITGTVEKKNQDIGTDETDRISTLHFYKSTFNRTFPLPDNVNADKMQMTPEKDKIVLKFPKVSV